jgi:hypothetical protein
MPGQRFRLSRERRLRRPSGPPCRHSLRLLWGCLNHVLPLRFSLHRQAPHRVPLRRAFRARRGQVFRARRLPRRPGMCRWGHSMRACPPDRVRERFFPVRGSHCRPPRRLAARYCLVRRDRIRRSSNVRLSSPSSSHRADKACRLVILCARLCPANRLQGR